MSTHFTAVLGRTSDLPHQWCTQEFFRGLGVVHQEFFRGVSTNSVEDRGQRERRSGGGSPLVRVSTQFENE
jgi:hypothetical protein